MKSLQVGAMRQAHENDKPTRPKTTCGFEASATPTTIDIPDVSQNVTIFLRNRCQGAECGDDFDLQKSERHTPLFPLLYCI